METPGVEELLDLAVTALGGRRRDGQHRMAIAVGHAIDRGEHLLVQAGTGTGKSLAYLVPAVRHAVLAEERVVVSTATLALQRHVMARDLPLVASAVAPRLPRAPRVALLKGWHNYLCRNRVAGGYPEEEPAALFDVAEGRGAAEHPRATDPLGRQVVRLREWAEETTTGDRDDLVPGVSDRAWRQVSVTAMDCLGKACPFADDCFPDQARERAREADVVVTNHALLGIAASGSPGVLPEHDVLVVDEAHELAERVTAQATAELSAPVVERAARLARRHGGVPSDELMGAAAALDAALATATEGRLPNGPEGALVGAVEAVRDAARSLLTALRPESAATGSSESAGSGDGTRQAGLKMATSAVLVVFEVAERMAGDGARDGRDVVWTAGEEPGDRPGRLLAAPLDVAGLVRGALFAGRTAVLTSATLALGASFVPLGAAVGLRPGELVAEDTGDGTGPSGAAPSAPSARSAPKSPTRSSAVPRRRSSRAGRSCRTSTTPTASSTRCCASSAATAPTHP